MLYHTVHMLCQIAVSEVLEDMQALERYQIWDHRLFYFGDTETFILCNFIKYFFLFNARNA